MSDRSMNNPNLAVLDLISRETIERSIEKFHNHPNAEDVKRCFRHLIRKDAPSEFYIGILVGIMSTDTLVQGLIAGCKEQGLDQIPPELVQEELQSASALLGAFVCTALASSFPKEMWDDFERAFEKTKANGE